MTELCGLSDLETPDELLILDEKLDERVGDLTNWQFKTLLVINNINMYI